WMTSYPIGSTYEVYFATVVPGTLAGHNTETLDVFVPGGTAWQRFTFSFATTVMAGAGEQQAQKITGGYLVWASMPVAGTDIDSYGLTGSWSAVAYVNGASKP